MIENRLILPLREKLERFFEKRNRVATDNFLRALGEMGEALGYNFDKGDRCFIHPDDIPPSVKLKPGMPVVESTTPAMVSGRLLWAKRRDIPQCLNAPPVFVRREGTMQ